MKPEIQLDSKYGIDNRLIRVGDDSLKYKLKTPHNYRVGLIEGNPDEYSFVDPTGDPFITKGVEIEGHVVKVVHNDDGIIVEFES